MSWTKNKINKVAHDNNWLSPGDHLIDAITGEVLEILVAGSQLPLTRRKKIGRIPLPSRSLTSIICYSAERFIFLGDRKKIIYELKHLWRIDQESSYIFTISCAPRTLHTVRFEGSSIEHVSRFIFGLRTERQRRYSTMTSNEVEDLLDLGAYILRHQRETDKYRPDLRD